jgi:hypothetical protein
MDRRDFGRGAASAFDRAVHVSLPSDAGVLAREEQPPARSRQPRPKIGRERRVKERVATTRVRIVLPDNLV